MDDILLELGFKDITKERPLHFIECLSETANVYHLSKRYAIGKAGFAVEVLVGERGNITYFIIKLIGMNYCQHSTFDVPREYFKEYFENVLCKMINSYVMKIRESFNSIVKTDSNLI